MIYFNNAATSFPKPEIVKKTIIDVIGKPFFEGGRGITMNTLDYVSETRKSIARLFCFKDPERVIFTSSATESLNLVINGISRGFEKPHIVSSYNEHNSVLRPLFHLLKEKKIFLTLVKPDIKGILHSEIIENSIRRNTKAIILSHVSNVLGNILDLESVGEICNNNNILWVVDAAQSAGLVPINIHQSKIDFLIFTGHKNLFGLPGIGGLLINSDIDLKPLKYGGTGIKSNLIFQPNILPLYYESGTPNYPGIISLYAGCRFLEEKMIGEIEKKVKSLTFYLINSLNEMHEIILQGENSTGNRLSIVSFTIKNTDPSDIGYILQNSYDIITRTGLHCAPLIHKCIGTFPMGSIRVSLSYFNTIEEIDRFLIGIQEIIKSLKDGNY